MSDNDLHVCDVSNKRCGAVGPCECQYCRLWKDGFESGWASATSTVCDMALASGKAELVAVTKALSTGLRAIKERGDE